MFTERAPRICSGGLVYCPLRKSDASIETCLACEWLERVEADGREDVIPASIRCAPPRQPATNADGWVA